MRSTRSWAARITRIFALRLMISMGVAALVSQEFALQRSYWVMLTVAIVLRPDFGSVFARALQRGIGTVVGAVAGALIIAGARGGPWLLVPCAVLAGLLPYGQLRNWGLLSTFLTPLVVILIDLLQWACWVLALDRLVDTLLGCAIVLLVGYAPWPSSWHAHLPRSSRRSSIVWRVTRRRHCSACPAGPRSAARPTEPCPTFARSFSAPWQNPAPPAGPRPGCGQRCSAWSS